MAGNGSLWSYSYGEKGLNRIRVYERRENGPIYIEWYDDFGRHQKSLTTAAGFPVFDKDIAMKTARRTAEAQAKKRNAQTAHTLLGLPEPHTLGELLQTYHEAHPQWSKDHTYGQNNARRFWEHWLGKDRLLSEITPARAAAALRRATAEDAMRERPRIGARSQQKYVKYIREAFFFAQKKLKWITEKDNLSALDIPKYESVSRPYSKEEALAVLEATEQVDLRLAVMAHLTLITGRRAAAIRTLTRSSYLDEGEFGRIIFPGHSDKARRTGEVFVTGKTKQLLEKLLSTPASKASGLIFPGGELQDRSSKRTPWAATSFRNHLEEAEKLAGVPHIEGRAFHGLKRRFATEALRHDPGAAEKQSGTNRSMLERVYRQDDPTPKKELARAMEELLEQVC